MEHSIKMDDDWGYPYLGIIYILYPPVMTNRKPWKDPPC